MLTLCLLSSCATVTLCFSIHHHPVTRLWPQVLLLDKYYMCKPFARSSFSVKCNNPSNGGNWQGATGRKSMSWQDTLLSLHHYYHHIKCWDCYLTWTRHCDQILRIICSFRLGAGRVTLQRDAHCFHHLWLLRKWRSINGSDRALRYCYWLPLDLTSLYFLLCILPLHSDRWKQVV